jgi:glycerophosphoryl diester phosphodiesterase
MMVIGHRGLAGLAPENTLASFRAAAAHGLAMVEFDVRLSCDGMPLVFHDDTLERTTDGTGPVAERDWGGLAALDAGSWFGPAFAGERVPSLEQALRLCLKLGLAVNMELKPDQGREAETARRALAAARRRWPDAAPPPLVSSFVPRCLEVARDEAPAWPRAILAERLPPGWAEAAGALGAGSLHLDHRFLAPAQVADMAARGLAVRAYTVNEASRAEELRAWGVAAVFSDIPHSS